MDDLQNTLGSNGLTPSDPAALNGDYLGQVSPRTITQEVEDSYIDYAMSVIVSRALPDIRDGLKPVQRRILYAMYSDLALRPNSPYKKSARIIGEVLGKYHPHGEEAIYNAMARMIQPFSLRYPLVDGQGNFGSIDGDNPAAMRYTEARLARLTDLMLQDIDKNTVEWKSNFDESLEEPEVIPSLVPNLLVNGTSGIAVGMATNVPPLNMGEVIEGLLLLLDNWERRETFPLDEMLSVVHGPDFPSGGQVLGTEGFTRAFSSGHGRIVVRAGADIYDIEGSQRQQIVFDSVPYMVNKSELITRIAQLVREGERLTGISDLRDESDREGTRIVVELRSGEIPERVLNQLYKHCDLQVTFSVNFRALVDGRPERLGLLRAMVLHLEHCIEVVTRRTQYLLEQVQQRAHILEGLLTAIDHIERVIQVIRGSESARAAGEILKEELGISDAQVQAILDMALRRLAGLERQRLQEEYAETQERVAYYQGLLADPAKVRGVIGDELGEIRDQHADPRRTQILHGIHPDLSDEDLVTKQDELATVFASHYVRRTPISDFSLQRRGGVGVRGRSDKEEASVVQAVFANSLDRFLCVTDAGRVYQGRMFELPAGLRTGRGGPVRGSLSMSLEQENISCLHPVPTDAEPRSLIMITRRGTIKRMQWSDFRNVRRNGKKAIDLRPGDQVVQSLVTDGASELLMLTRSGSCARIDERTIRYLSPVAMGVRGMRLRPGDHMAGIVRFSNRQGERLFILHESGKGKQLEMGVFRLMSRGNYGSMATPRRRLNELGPIASAITVEDGDEILVLSAKGNIVRIAADEVRAVSQYGSGVRVISLEDSDRAAAAVRVPPSPQEDRSQLHMEKPEGEEVLASDPE